MSLYLFHSGNGLFQKLDAHPLKKIWESLKKFYSHFSLGIPPPKKINHIFGCKDKEDVEIPKNFDCFWYEKWEFSFFFLFCFVFCLFVFFLQKKKGGRISIFFSSSFTHSYKTGTSHKTCFWGNSHKRWLAQNYFKIFKLVFSCLLSGEQCILSNVWKNLFKWDFFSNNKWWIKSVNHYSLL